jgi:hypothetical protein
MLYKRRLLSGGGHGMPRQWRRPGTVIGCGTFANSLRIR